MMTSQEDHLSTFRELGIDGRGGRVIVLSPKAEEKLREAGDQEAIEALESRLYGKDLRGTEVVLIGPGDPNVESVANKFGSDRRQDTRRFDEPSVGVWSGYTQRKALEDGWGIFDAGDGEFQLQRLDVPSETDVPFEEPRFLEDVEVWHYVAQADNGLKQAALAFLAANNPEEAARVLATLKPDSR